MWRRGDDSGGPAIAVAHRGGEHLGANVVAAVDALVGLGVEMVEFDVRRTADHVLIVHHDPLRNDMELSAHSYAELVSEGGSLTTLAAFLDAVDGRLALDVELKEAGYEAAVLDAVLARAPLDGVVVTSFHDEALRAVRRAAPDVATGLLVGDRWTWRQPRTFLKSVFPFRRMARCQADFLAPSLRLLQVGALLRRARRRHIGLLVWTVNDVAAYDRLRGLPGVLGIVTDAAELLARPR